MLPDFKLERYFARWEFVAQYMLSSSDVQGWAMRDVLALADEQTRALWDDLSLGYTESAGHPLLRAEVARLYETARPDDALCCVSAEEAIYCAMRALLRPGDHIIATFPAYQSSYEVARGIGADVSFWEMRPQAGAWALDVDELRGMLRPNTKLIAVNFPNNPTGALPTHAQWDDIVSVARAANCHLLGDEVYRWMEYDPASRIPAAIDSYERGISIGAMSKGFGMAGLRVGWMATRDAELLARTQAYKDYTTICASAPSEILALIALRAKERVLERCMGIVKTNLALAQDFMQTHARWFGWVAPQAGSVAFPEWRGAQPVDNFADDLVRHTGVMMLPASVFDVTEPRFRVGLGRLNFGEALQKLDGYLTGL